MANRVASCPQAKQIVGVKNWLGFAGGFNFPGFKANWAGGAWIYSCAFTSGGTYACTGSAANFNPGDLVLVEFPAQGPITDLFTGIAQSYPKYWKVYICTTGITGSATSPATDSAHFALWDFQVFFVNPSGYLRWGSPNSYNGPDTSPDPGGPSGWPPCASGTPGYQMTYPNSLDYAATNCVGLRCLGSRTTDTANLTLNITTTFDSNFPLYPADVTASYSIAGEPFTGSQQMFYDPTVYEAGNPGSFEYSWSFAEVTVGSNTFVPDGAAPVETTPGTAPTASQATVCFPAVPNQRILTYIAGAGVASAASVNCPAFEIDNNPFTPILAQWSFSSSALSFTFGAWTILTGISYSPAAGAGGTRTGNAATNPGTITQTIELTGNTYTLEQVGADAMALMNATAFSSIAWGTSWTNIWNASGAVVSGRNPNGATGTHITASCRAGTELQWGCAVNGCLTIGVTQCYASRALADVCGNYCQRTYACPTVTCVSGKVDGYGPVELEPPGTAGESTGIYANCSCV
jgi:hypothetical protein